MSTPPLPKILGKGKPQYMRTTSSECVTLPHSPEHTLSASCVWSWDLREIDTGSECGHRQLIWEVTSKGGIRRSDTQWETTHRLSLDS